ncbi:MAG TPA: cytochrome c [Ilumatobacteraceae bacterium]|nr:cytochrome c [Ilumatobacteraceae bacterium]
MPTTPTAVNVTRAMLLLIALVVGVACGGSTVAELSPEAENGRRIANLKGCASCHAADGSGGVGPKFVGLYGSNVTLSDGSTIVADDAYLRRSITEPAAELVEGYTLTMPVGNLSDDELEAVLVYIRELASTP